MAGFRKMQFAHWRAWLRGKVKTLKALDTVAVHEIAASMKHTTILEARYRATRAKFPKRWWGPVMAKLERSV